MSDSTWTISNRTGYEAAGTVMQAGFTATVGHRGCVEAKINVEGPACSPDVDVTRRGIIELALKMTAELKEQGQRKQIEDHIVEAREQEKRLGELRLLYTTAKGERDAFSNYSSPNAGQQLVELGRKVDELKRQIDAVGDPSTVIATLTSQLQKTTELLVNAAKSTVTKQAIKQVTDQLLAKRAASLRQLEATVSPILDELAVTDIQYTQVMLDANPMSGTLPREIEAAIKQTVGADDSYPRISPVPASSAMPSTPAVPGNPQRW